MRYPSHALGSISAAVPSVPLLAACQSTPLTQPSWPAAPEPMALAEGAGLTPEPEEHLADGVTHELSDDGTANEYYVPGTCDAPCLSPLHTHDPTGLIHTESRDPDQEPYTLGQFFTEWGVRLDDDCVGEFCKADTPIVIYLNGDKHAGNPAEIELNSHLEIAIVIGTAPSAIPDNYTFFDPA